MELSRLKMLWLVSLVFIGIASARAQTYAEIFRQKKTQKKYLMEQLVALKTYAGYLKKGYDIASNGLNAVKDFTKGEFSLHNAFISSLKTVSPTIRSSGKVADIILLQLEISRSFRNIGQGSANTLIYVDEVRSNLMDECDRDLEELLLVITSGKTEMKEDERLRRLDKIYESILDKNAFVQSFCNQIGVVNGQRKREQQSIDQLRRYYESNKF
jgi:hypothetical protein